MLQQVYRSDRLSRKLLVLSFEFSQWEIWLQRCIFRYLHLRYPAWHPSEEETKALVQGTYLSVCKLLEKSDRNRKLPSDEVWEMENAMAKYYDHLPQILFEVYNDLEDQHLSLPEVVQRLAQGILEMDACYLLTDRPSQDPQTNLLALGTMTPDPGKESIFLISVTMAFTATRLAPPNITRCLLRLQLIFALPQRQHLDYSLILKNQ